jgi:hypothetical protein
MYRKINLVILKVLPFCTYTLPPVFPPLQEAPLEVLFWYGSETGWLILSNFLHGHKMTTFEPHLESWVEPEVTQSEFWRIWWLGDDWNLVLCQKVLHWERGVTGCVIIMQDPVVSPWLTVHTDVSQPVVTCSAYSAHFTPVLSTPLALTGSCYLNTTKFQELHPPLYLV